MLSTGSGAFPNSAPIVIVNGSCSYRAALAGHYLVYYEVVYEVVDDWAIIARIRDARRDITGFDPGSDKP